MNNRLYRSPSDRILAGVAGGMAETYDFDPALVRIGWALLILLSGGIFLVIYIVMALVVPLRPAMMPLWGSAAMSGAGAGPGGAGGVDGPSFSPGSPPPPDGPPPFDQPAPYGAYTTHREHRRNGTGAVVIGVMLVLVGVFFLIRQFIPAFDFDLIWPIAVIVGGGLLIAFAVTRRQP